jgi:hypothetical protein
LCQETKSAKFSEKVSNPVLYGAVRGPLANGDRWFCPLEGLGGRFWPGVGRGDLNGIIRDIRRRGACLDGCRIAKD